MRKVALLVVTSFGLAGCADSVFSPDWSRRTEPQFSSLPPAPQASEGQARWHYGIDPTTCTRRYAWLTC